MPILFQKILEAIISKKKIIAYVSALLIAVLATILGMKPTEIKDAIISGPVIELPASIPTPVAAPSK